MLSRVGLLKGACSRLTAGRRCAPAVAVRAFGAGEDPRAHLNPDGTRPEHEDGEGYHDPDPLAYTPYPLLIKERGQTWVKSQDPPKPFGEVFPDIPQTHMPFWPRHRIYIWGNYKLIMKAEYLYMYIPIVIILGLVIPSFTTIFTADELVASTMTVKVVGRQWYWVYEVESPTDDDDDE
eukprot:TRINITY_DN3552_c0_g1_i4.p1 TRINITY_DN3552_c0_g1~~TRINITY_DN3552_c0_g1_i4.p1  ORF type:complete len:179 (+),score=33.90 TRINITY_DN3552_c0_g1_i4:61-597(+)